MPADLDDGVHRAVQQRTHHGGPVGLGHGAVADQRRVAPVVEREVLGGMLGADSESVAHRAVELDSHRLTHDTTSTSYGLAAEYASERHESHSPARCRATCRGNARSRLAATFVAASNVAQAPRPRSTTDHRSSLPRSSDVATPSRKAPAAAAIAAVPLKHDPHCPAFSRSKYDSTDAATATG